MSDPIVELRELFAVHGRAEYLGEPVTQAAHMLQAAALAARDGAAEPLVAAALLHDVGHLLDGVSGHELMAGWDNHHSDAGAAWLARWFAPAVTEPVRLHVAAKRYLCAVEPAYVGALSEASRYTLSVQGGPMTPAEVAGFAADPFGAAAVALRRWDDAAKEPDAVVPAFDAYEALLRRVRA